MWFSGIISFCIVLPSCLCSSLKVYVGFSVLASDVTCTMIVSPFLVANEVGRRMMGLRQFLAVIGLSLLDVMVIACGDGCRVGSPYGYSGQCSVPLSLWVCASVMWMKHIKACVGVFLVI